MPNSQRILLIMLLSILASPLFGQRTMYVSADNLNLRNSPDIQSEVVEKVSYGEALTIIEDLDNGWKKIELSNGSVAYVFGKFISSTKPAEKVVKVRAASVLICNSSSAFAYHSYRCRGLSRCKAGISSVSISDAKSSGYKACKICY